MTSRDTQCPFPAPCRYHDPEGFDTQRQTEAENSSHSELVMLDAPPARPTAESRATALAEMLASPTITRSQSLTIASAHLLDSEDPGEAATLLNTIKRIQDGIDAAREAISAEEYWSVVLSYNNWTDPQRELLAAIRNPDLAVVVAYGPVACGKTISLTAGLVGLMLTQGEDNAGVVHGVITRSRQQAGTTILSNLQRWAHSAWSRVTPREDGWSIADLRLVRSVGAHDTSAHQIQGGDWAGALVNEGTILPVTMMNQVVERCRVGWGKVLVDTNPDTPANEFEVNYVRSIEAGERSGKVVRFALVDEDSWNPDSGTYDSSPCWWHPASYVESLCRTYPRGTPEHDRRILGKAAFHSGMVFPNVGQCLAPWDGVEPEMWLISIDVGFNNSATHAIAIAASQSETGEWSLSVCNEWRYSGSETGVPRGFGWQTSAVLDWIAEIAPGHQNLNVIVDEAESQFIKELAMGLSKRIQDDPNEPLIHAQLKQPPAKSTVDESIRAVHSLTDPDFGYLRIDSARCPELVGEMQKLMWREDAAKRDLDKPTIGEDHGVAALRYAAVLWELGGPGRVLEHKVMSDPDVQAGGTYQ